MGNMEHFRYLNSTLEMTLKEVLLTQCMAYVNARSQTIEDAITSHQKALQSETKSSAGDKHETGRAMLQLEMEKAGQQLASIHQMKETLAKIDPLKRTDIASLGAIVETSQGHYFLSVSVGQIEFQRTMYFAISTSSPIGRLLLGKKEGEELVWNSRKIKIYEIS